ncbi:MAG TPA: bifunctional hydroxymethylpyrimidine kinase/phosphomethylpyrimidine kinase [Clostridiales bacterium]|nr:bifunctional hydroxymethylpyrimidine kinase/phosphomethylpyrimidine kinase [Clostridiales bacterium]
MKKVLSIAGSDCSGGAGIQADIKTITAHKMYAMSVITALTAQNTTGVSRVLEVGPGFVEEQLDMVCSDIYPDAVKIGMLVNEEIIEVVADSIKKYRLKNIVLDPVMISTSGRRLLKDAARQVLISRLIPLADIITPNLSEAEYLTGRRIESKADMQRAAEDMLQYYQGSILIKGGHLPDSSDDLLYHKGRYYWYGQRRIDNSDTHGTGCTLSSAIACNLAKGINMQESVANGKAYITGAISAKLRLGHGNGPLDHCWEME